MSPPGTSFKDLLSAGLRRREHPPVDPLTVFRVANGPGDGLPAGVSVDRYGEAAVVNARVAVPEDVVQDLLAATGEVLAPETLVLKRWAPKVRDSTSRVVFGNTLEVEVAEGAARFGCHLDDGLQTGLFLDHRDTRLLVHRLAEGREVLNAFAYTCAFSVHAALGGAVRVTSVDSSKKALHRGRDNMVRSGLDPNGHRWFDDDVLAHVGRGGAAYDLIVMDPPLFGRAKKRSFALLDDLETLVARTVAKLRPGGILVLSTHALEVDEARMLAAARVTGRPFTIEASLGLPAWDHPVEPGVGPEDRGDYLKTLVLRFEAE